MRQSFLSSQSKNILLKDTSNSLTIINKYDQIQIQKRQPHHQHKGTLDSLDQFLGDDKPGYAPKFERQQLKIRTEVQLPPITNNLHQLSRRGSQILDVRPSNEMPSTMDSIEPVFISPQKPKRKVPKRNASVLMKPDYDMNKFFSIEHEKNISEECPKQKKIVAQHKHTKSQPITNKQYQLIGFTDYVEALYGSDWFEEDTRKSLSELDEFFKKY